MLIDCGLAFAPLCRHKFPDRLIGSEDGSLGFFKGIGDGEVAFLVDLQPFSAVRGYNCSAPAMTFWNEDQIDAFVETNIRICALIG